MGGRVSEFFFKKLRKKLSGYSTQFFMGKVSDSSIVFFSQSNGLFFSFSTNFISLKSNGWKLSNLNLNENTLWQKNRAKYCRESYISYKIILFLIISYASYFAVAVTYNNHLNMLV